MRLRNSFAAGLVLTAVLALVCNCSTTVEILNQPATTTNDPPEISDDSPQPVDINGTWDTYATELADTCGFDPPEPYAPMLVTETGEGVTVAVADATGVCQESARTRDGDTVRLIRTDVLDLNGAFVRIDLQIAYDFTADSFNGTVIQSFTDLSNAFPDDLPCEVTLAVSGNRCDDCWTGCTSTQGHNSGSSGHELDSVLRDVAAR